MSVLRVLIADDDSLVCAYLSSQLSAVDGIEVTGVAGDGAEAVEMAIRTGPDVVLMDIRMPGLDGIQATEELTRGDEGPAVLLMTTVDSDHAVVAGLSAGASGYALKTSPTTTIVDALRTAAAGVDVLSPEATRRLLRLATQNQVAEEDPRITALAGREREVLRLVGEGRTNSDIARTLYLAESTVKGHVSRLMDTLDCDNRTKLALMAPRES